MRSVSCSPREPEIVLTFFTRLSSDFLVPVSKRTSSPRVCFAHESPSAETGPCRSHHRSLRAASAPTSPASWPGVATSSSWSRRSAEQAAVPGRRADRQPRHGPRTSYPSTCPTARRATAWSPSSTSRGLTPHVLVNNAGFSTTRPGAHASDPGARAEDLVEVDVAAVVGPLQPVPPRAWCERGRRRRAQRGLDGGVPAAARAGGVRRCQGVRALLHAQPLRASSRAPVSPPPCSARVR